ncbi:hypothetical protein D4R42_01395, partial [bacterium]
MKKLLVSVLMMFLLATAAKADWGYTTNVTVSTNGLTFTFLGLDAPADLTLFNINFTNLQAWANTVTNGLASIVYVDAATNTLHGWV